jgi:hypothetical protein
MGLWSIALELFVPNVTMEAPFLSRLLRKG